MLKDFNWGVTVAVLEPNVLQMTPLHLPLLLWRRGLGRGGFFFSPGLVELVLSRN
jgi:hypothetical protein